MDPAGAASPPPDSLQQALAGQGALLRQHDQVLKALLTQVTGMSQTLQNLQNQLPTQGPQPAPNPPLPVTSPSPQPHEPFAPS